MIAGSGKAFCAGHDLKEMRAQPSFDYYKTLFANCSSLMITIQKLPQPVVAKVHGFATAAGCQLVSMCDLAISTSDCRFAVSGINYGLFCSTPSVGLSRNIHRKQAMEMLLTGDWIDSTTAVQRGLINKAVEKNVLDDEVLSMCNKIASKPQEAIQIGKRLFYEQVESDVLSAYDMANNAMAHNMMDKCALEGFQAFIEKRDPTWKKVSN